MTPRYASKEMKEIWDEINKRKLWRQLWIRLANCQIQTGLVSKEQVKDLEAHKEDIDLKLAAEFEEETQHELVAELKTFASQAPEGGKILHLGATSTDILDNADIMMIKQSIMLLINKLKAIIIVFGDFIEQLANITTTGYTHLQKAQPTTIGYRLAFTAQDLLADLEELKNVSLNLKTKGFRGAVGTRATYQSLDIPDIQLERPNFIIVSQIYPRKQDWRVLNALAGLGATLHKFALDVRLLQSPLAEEWSEGFKENQVGSSAMPYKKNPILSEKICGLSRYLSCLPKNAWDNAANSMLERTLDDSSNRRLLLPDAFLITDELLEITCKLIWNLYIYRDKSQASVIVNSYASSEEEIINLVRQGYSRQEAYNKTKNNLSLSSQNRNVGDAPERALKIAKLCKNVNN